MLKEKLHTKMLFITLTFVITAAAIKPLQTRAGTVTTSPSSLTFTGAPKGVIQFQEVTITVSGVGLLSKWSLFCSAGFSMAETAGGQPVLGISFLGPKTVKMFVTPTDISIAGELNGFIEVSGFDIGSTKIPLKASLKTVPVVNPTSLFFDALENLNTAPQDISVTIDDVPANSVTTVQSPGPLELLTTANGTPLSSLNLTGVGPHKFFVRAGKSSVLGVTKKDLVLSGVNVVTKTLPVTIVNSANPTFFPSSIALSTIIGQPSAAQKIAVTVLGVQPGSTTEVKAPTGFSVLSSANGTPQKFLILSAPGTSDVFVRAESSTTLGTISGQLQILNLDAGSKFVPVKVTVLAKPTPVVNPTSLSGFTAIQGGATSPAQSFDVSITGLPTQTSSTVTVTAPAGYLVSLSGAAGSFFGAFILTGTGTIKSKVFVAIKNTSAIGLVTGDVTISGNQIVTKAIPVTGTVTAKPAPTITVDKTSLPAFSTTTNKASATQSYNLRAKNLDAGVNPIVKAPAGYEVSLTNNTGSIFVTQLTLTHTADSVNLNVFVRLKSSATVGSITGTIQNTVAGITKNVNVSGSVVLPPAVTVNPTSITALNTVKNQPSAAKTYTLLATGLQAGNTAVVTPSANFEVRIQNTGSFVSSLTLAQTSTGTINRVVEVRLKAIATIGTITGSVQNVVAGFTKTVTLSGTVGAPTLTATTSALTFSTVKNQASATQTYKLTATNLATGLTATVTASANYEFSLQSNGTFTSSLTLPQNTVNGISTDVFVRLKSTATTGSISGTVINTVAGLTKTITLTGNVIAPALSVNSATMSGFSMLANQASAAQSYTLLASGLATGLTASVTAPAGYEVSIQGTNIFSGTLTIAQTSEGTISKTILVRLKAKAAKSSATGNVVNTVAGITKNVAVSGVVPNPSLALAVNTEDPKKSLVETEFAPKAFPNPFTNYVTVEFSAKANSNVQIKLISLNGTVALNENVRAAGGLQRVQLSPVNLAPGLYIINVTTSGEQKIIKVVRK